MLFLNPAGHRRGLYAGTVKCLGLFRFIQLHEAAMAALANLVHMITRSATSALLKLAQKIVAIIGRGIDGFRRYCRV